MSDINWIYDLLLYTNSLHGLVRPPSAQIIPGEPFDALTLGRLMNPPQAISFAEIAREAVALVQGRIAARGLQVDIEPDLSIVYGDRERLVEVVQNLVDNARKFMGDQPQPHRVGEQ